MTPERVDRAVHALYGTSLPKDGGVLHVAAVWEDADGGLHNMHIVDATPESPSDAFALALARARADALVTTGRILRAEPELDHDASRAPGGDLTDWRRRRMGRETAPRLVVLTRSGDVDPEHPALAGREATVLTGEAGARALAARVAGGALEVVARASPGLLDALSYLRDERGLASVLVEAGPSTASALYDGPGRVDELMLSVCRRPALPEGVRGDPFPPRARFAAAGLACVSARDRHEPSGPWRFERWRAGAAA